MGFAEAVTIVNAPVREVWDILNDIDHTPEWVVGLEAAEIKTPGPLGAGSVYHDHNRLGPFPQETPWHVTVFEPFARQVHVSQSSVIPTTLTLYLEPVPEGTRVRMTIAYRLLPGLRAVSRMLEAALMNRLIASVIRQNLDNLAQHMAQGAGEPAL